jgi:hypothetical protein
MPPPPQWLANELETKHYLMSNVYGSHVPMQIRMELETVCQSRRLPGMTTSNIGAETLLGRDETIDFEDYLGDPRMSETPVDMRAALEKKHGLTPRNSLHGRMMGGATSGPANIDHTPRTNVAAVKVGF